MPKFLHYNKIAQVARLVGCAVKAACYWVLVALGICMTFTSPVLAAAFPVEITNTATVEVPTGWSDTVAENNKSSAKLKKHARLKIIKRTEGGNGTFGFSSTNTVLDSTEVITVAGLGDSGFKAVESGSYELSEKAAKGWTLKSVSCADPDEGTVVEEGSQVVKLDVDDHEDIECTFLNQKNASFTLRKITEGGEGSFDFETDLGTTDGTLVNKKITTTDGAGSFVYDDVKPGTHTLKELSQTGWDLTSITCSLADTNGFEAIQDVDLDGVLDKSEISFNIVPNEAASCTYTNRKAVPELNVTKMVVGSVSYKGDDVYSVGMKISTVNSGNTPILLTSISDDLVSAFDNKALITAVSTPVFASNEDNFTGTLNSQFDGKSGLKGNSENLLSSSGKLKVGQMISVTFEIDFKPTDSSTFSIFNVAKAAGTGAGLPVEDMSHDTEDPNRKGSNATPIAIDPSGVVYDSVALTPVAGALVTLAGPSGAILPDVCLANGQQSQITDASGFYRFDINVGAHPDCPVGETAYKLNVVPPPAYTFESVIRPVSGPSFDATSCVLTAGKCAIDDSFSPASIAASYTYYLEFSIGSGDPDVIQNHIPIDPAAAPGDVSLTKTARIASASIGDVLPYELKITNEASVPLSNFVVVDKLPVGVSYIPNSSRISIDGGSEAALHLEPTTSGNQLSWKIEPSLATPYNAISPGGVFSLSFQTRVTSMKAGGQLINNAVVENRNGVAISQNAQATVELRPEPIFQCSSILGTVFHDQNGDGILNHPNDRNFDQQTMTAENGIPNASLFTVNGQWIKTDDHGRYSIPCAMLPQTDIGSNYALKLLATSLPNGLVPPKSNPQIVRLTPGLMSVLNFAVTEGDIDSENSNLQSLPIFAADQTNLGGAKSSNSGPIYLAMFDVTANQKLSDSVEVTSDPEIDGRLAVYLKGRIKGDVLLTLMADTGEGDIKGLFNDFMEQDKQAYLKRIDPARYYPVFGDDSSMVEDAPTSGKLYVRLEKDSNLAVWGSVRAELADSAFVKANRVLYGAKVHLQTEVDKTYTLNDGRTFMSGGTKFGEARLTVDAYAARPESLKARDNFRGHMGTVFYLQNADVLPGSEVVEIETRTVITGQSKASKRLVYGKDYQIDYIFGRVTLTNPLPSNSNGETLFDLGSQDGDALFLNVDYSHSGTNASATEVVSGGSAKIWVTDYVRVGVQGQNENAAGDQFDLISGDLTLRLDEQSKISVEYAQSKGTASLERTSDDGGFTWISSQSQSSSSQVAEAISASLEVNLEPYLMAESKLTATFEAKEKGFIDNTGRTETDTSKLNVEAKVRLSETEEFSAKVEVLDQAIGENQQQLTASYKRALSERTQIEVSGQTSNKGGKRKHQLGGLVETALTSDLRVRVFGATDLSNDATDESFVGLGFDYEPFENLRVNLNARRHANDRYSAEIGGSWKRDADSEFYLSYLVKSDGLDAGISSIGTGQVVVGGLQSIGDHLSLKGEEKLYLEGGTPDGATHAYSLAWEGIENWHVGLGVEYGEVSQKERLAIAASIKATVGTNATSSAVFEFREDTDLGTNEVTQTYLGRGSLSAKVSDSWRHTVNLEGMVAAKEGMVDEEGLYLKANIGSAYRPKDNDEWAALMMYTFLYDLPPEQQLDKGQFKQIAHLFSVEASYRVSPDLRLTGKYGLKSGKQTVDRSSGDWSDVLVQLGVLRADLRLSEKFDALIEGRMMSIKDPNELRKALLGALYYRLDDQIKVGGGYTFGHTSSDLLNHDKSDQGWFINFVGAF